MAHMSFTIFIFIFVIPSSTFVLSYGFKVIQRQVQDVNRDQTASISCENDAKRFTLQDVRLYSVSQNGKKMLCQKGLDSCKNIDMIEHNPNKFVFILRNVGPEAMEFTYQCEITVTVENVDHTVTGTPTKLKPDFTVIQRQLQDVNKNQTASISCEHDAEGFPIQDVQLYRITHTGQEVMLCRKGQDFCGNIAKYPHNPRKFVFILLNVGPEAMDFTYQCAITVAVGNTDYTERGTPIKLQQDEKDSPSSNELTWILIGLLALVFFYSCVITCLYVRLTVTIWKNSGASENSTYVVMKPPNQKSQYEDIYHMQMSSA